MITKEIKICGKQVNLAYCYATEIIFKELTGDDIIDYVKSSVERINDGKDSKDPDAKHSVRAIEACLSAYYDKDMPLTRQDIEKEITPSEMILAVLAILQMRAEFYHIPKDEPADKEEANPKND